MSESCTSDSPEFQAASKATHDAVLELLETEMKRPGSDVRTVIAGSMAGVVEFAALLAQRLRESRKEKSDD